MTVHQLQDRGAIMVHGSQGSAVLKPDKTYVEYLILKDALPGGGTETPMITFVPHVAPQPIGTEEAATE